MSTVAERVSAGLSWLISDEARDEYALNLDNLIRHIGDLDLHTADCCAVGLAAGRETAGDFWVVYNTKGRAWTEAHGFAPVGFDDTHVSVSDAEEDDLQALEFEWRRQVVAMFEEDHR